MTNRNECSAMNTGMGQQYGNTMQQPVPWNQKRMKPFTMEDQAVPNVAQVSNVVVQSVNEVRKAANVISCCTAENKRMMQNINENVTKTIEGLGRKKRRKCISTRMFMDTNGIYGLCRFYDDGTTENFHLFLNVKGAYDVQAVEFKRYLENNDKYVLIDFCESNCAVWCEKGKNFTRSNLYRWFREAGIQFSGCATQKEIENVLYDTFVSQVQNPKQTLQINELAGWNQVGKWNYSTGYSLSGVPSLPCMRKKFSKTQKDKKRLEQFLLAFAEIKNQSYRIIMLETLVYGMLSSILTREGWTERYFLNFVLLEDIPEEWFCRLYQIFDRERPIVLNTGEKTDEIVKIIRALNDEVLILSVLRGQNVYKQKKSEEQMNAIVHKICGQDVSTMGLKWKVNAALVVLNHYISDSKKAINILTDTTIFSDVFVEMLKSDAVDSFLSEFVCYVEEHMQEITKTIRKYKNRNIQSLLSLLWKILEMFCEENEINIYNLTQTKNSLSFDKILENLKDRLEVDENIVLILLENIGQVYMREKRYGCKQMENCCYWDAEYYYIPTKIFQCIVGKNGISKIQMKSTLLKWKEDKVLIPDGEGITYRLRLDMTSIETYRFKRVLFDKKLDIPMVDLGKESVEC